MEFSLLSITLRRPRPDADWLTIRQALEKLTTEDPTVRIETDEDAGAIVISGLRELQLEIFVNRLRRESGVQVRAERPRVVYRERLTRAADGEMKYARQVGGRGQYGHVKIHLYPGEPGTGYVFSNEIAGGAIPQEFIKGVHEGVKDALMRGVLAGFPIDDVRVVLYDGSYHDVDSSEMAFRIAASMALYDAAKKAKPVLLEPVMRVEVTAPTRHSDDIIRDLATRRCCGIKSKQGRKETVVIDALVPLSEMIGYSHDLRKLTSGLGIFDMRFDHYQPMQRTEGDVDRDSFVGAPRKPFSPLRSSRAAMPEPDDDRDDGLQETS